MFVRGGNVNPGTSLNSAGYYGFYWSSVGSNIGSDIAYGLGFGSDNVNPSRNYSRDLGLSVRCVALGG